MKKLKGYEYNKYSKKLEDYIASLNDGEAVDLKICAKYREKANKLRKEKSFKLYNYINTTKEISLDTIEKLIYSGADVNYKFNFGISVFMLAVLNGQLNCLWVLKQNGSDVNGKNAFGQDALMLAGFMNSFKDYFGKNYSKTKYLPIIKFLKEDLSDDLVRDNAGLSQEDYLSGHIENFPKEYLKLVEKILKVKNNEIIF